MNTPYTKSYTLLFIAFLLLFYSVHAQDDIYFEHIGTNHGLSQNDINCIYQDNQGFMWFGTHDGLNKYDGYNFTVYTPNPNNPNSINSNLIFAITGDKKDNLWIGTSGRGLNYFDRSTEKFTHFVHDESDPNSIGNNQIFNLFIDSKNRLWVAANKNIDVANLNKPLDSLKFKSINLNKDNKYNLKSEYKYSVYTFFEDSKNQIWATTSIGLFKLDESSGEIKFNLYGNSLNRRLKAIIETPDQKLYVSISRNLFTIDLNNETGTLKKVGGIPQYLASGIDDILYDTPYLWVGTNSGLLQFNTKQGKKTQISNLYKHDPKKNSSLSKNSITSLYKDKTGIIWVGTNGGGINKFDPNRKHIEHIKNTSNPNSLSYDKIRAFYEDSNGYLWVGTEGGGINLMSKDTTVNKTFKKFGDNKKAFAFEEITIQNRKLLLTGGEFGKKLYQLDITDPNNIFEVDFDAFKDIKGSVFSILKDRQKNLWIGTYQNGIHRWLYNKETQTYKKDKLESNPRDYLSISSNIIRNIYEDSKGDIWIATGNGLSRLLKSEKYKENPKFIVYKNNIKDKNSISHNYILELKESSRGEFWIGTFGGGLNKFIPSIDGKSDSFIRYNETNGLPNNVIKGILEDDKKNLWISTNKGISKFNPATEIFKNYDVNDGLQDNEFQELARLKRENGDLIFGGINGFNVFNPKDIKDNKVEAQTVITGLSISNRPINIGEEINHRVILNKSINKIEELKLKHKENSLSFEFAALHYAAPQKNKFAYMLEGFDDDWIYTSSNKRFATYTNLEPDTYILKVKASNNDDIWDSTPSELKIIISPPFWQTKLAFLIYGLIFIAFLLLYRRFTIISTSKKHSLELEHLEKEKNNELQRIKLEFFTNITHEFTTPLTLIKGPLKFLQKQGDKLDNSVVQEQYKLMQKNSDYLLRLITQLLDFRKINQGKMRLVMRKSNIVNFIKEVSEPFQFTAQKHAISFHITASNNNLVSWFDHDSVEKIMNNLLSNAFKFTPDNGFIKINIHEENGPTNYVVIEVVDSGAGMDKDKVENIFERFFSEKNIDKKNSKGMGIGLAFVKNIVELHQGYIMVNSKPNEGTQFTVKLPVNKKAYLNVPEITCKEISESDFEIRSSESDSFAISINDEIEDQNLVQVDSDLPELLLVDDNEDIRAFIVQALKSKFKIHTAENGQEGLEILKTVSPKLIVTDIMMPIMDGIEFCKHVKSKKETSHIPVVMLTAKLSQESEITGLKIGADGYIRKPFDVEILELKLNNILQHRENLRNKFNLDITLQPKEVTVTSQDERFLNQAIAIVEKHMMNTDFNVEMLVKEMGFSRTNLYTKFKEITGLSSSEFIRNIRLKRAVQLFEQSDLSVKEIMYMTGFNTSSYFAKCFKKQFGVIPSEYVKQKKNK
ncbi:two-component regulator propeller domain-containing protein [Postechiella marina]|uniref:histidine kinase n=1 Tax=Postechiella marina TaxID=943941 RepID=A0ABP8BYW7_9FLAO